MRIYEINSGQKRQLQTTNFKSIWNKLIVPNCSEIIEIYKSDHYSILYRGMNTTTPIIRGSSRTSRNMKDSYILLSELFDVGLKECGMTALRSNSIFAINDRDHAELFGKIYILFPINGFEYTYTNYFDLTLNNLYYFIKSYLNNDLIKQIDDKSPDYLKLYDNWYENPEFFNLHENLESNMIKINALLDQIKLPHITSEDLINIEKFKTNVNPQNSGFGQIHFTRELMINGSYYAFNATVFINSIMDKLRR